MFRKPILLNVLIAIVTLVAVAGAFTSFQRKRSSFERLDFQFHWKKGVIIVDGVDPGSGAEMAGLEPGDTIWMIGSTPSTEVEGLKRTLRRLGPVPLLIARGDQTMTLHYAAPGLKIDYRYLFFTFIGFLYLAIALFTVFRSTRAESALFYFVCLLAFIVYVYSPAGKTDETFVALFLLEELARIFLPPLTLHFFLRFPRPLLANRWLFLAIYGVPAIVALWVFDVYIFNNAIEVANPETSMQTLDRWEMLHFAVYFTLAFIALTYTFRTAPAAGQKKQIKWMYLGMAVGFIPFLVLYLIPFVTTGEGTVYTTFAVLPLALIPLAFAVSILRYKLWDVEVVIKEVLAYTIMFVFGMIAFSTVNLLLSHMIEERLALERNFLAFASGLLIAGVLVPVKGRIESVIEMFLYRDTYLHRKAIAGFAQELATFHDLRELIEIVRERLAAAIGIHRMNLFVREHDAFTLYSIEAGVPRLVAASEFAAVPVSRPLILSEPRLPDASELPQQLLRAGYRYLFPLRHRGELQGLLLIGMKEAEEPLSRDDIQLIGSLTAPVSLAIENARLYGRLRRQLDEIRSLKEFNENIIESSSSAIVVVTNDGVVLTGNRAFWELIGAPQGAEGDIDTLFPPWAEVRDAPDLASELHFTNRRGEEKELAVSASPFNAPDAPPGATVIAISDITDRVRLERELQEKDRLASLGLLAAGVAHEVNTPLAGISSYAQLLLADTSPDDPRYAILKKMEQQTFRASHIVNNLLNFAANRPRSVDVVSLPELVRATVGIHEDLFNAKEIALHVAEIPDALLPANFYEMQQVLTNLLLNARDACARGGNVWIDGEKGESSVTVRVRDDGRGIPAELQARIFQPLVTTKRGQGGTGLGLAISERIVKSIGGEITVESAPGAGATFSIILPLWNDTEAH